MASNRRAEKIDLPDSLDLAVHLGHLNPGVGNCVPWISRLDEQEREVVSNLQASRYCNRQALVSKLQGLRNSTVFVYHSHNVLTDFEVDALIQFFNGVEILPRLDLVLSSQGGVVSSAYKLGEVLHEYCGTLSVLIPARAKSAATVIALAGNEIVMGPSSELGPIDPQIPVFVSGGGYRYVPALSVKDLLTFVEQRVGQEPASLPIYKGLLEALDPMTLGHYLREVHSAKQYAEAFLTKYSAVNSSEASIIAESLTQDFSSHGFCINIGTARGLGLKVTKARSEEWSALNELYHLCEREIKSKEGIGGLVLAEGFEYALPG